MIRKYRVGRSKAVTNSACVVRNRQWVVSSACCDCFLVNVAYERRVSGVVESDSVVEGDETVAQWDPERSLDVVPAKEDIHCTP